MLCYLPIALKCEKISMEAWNFGEFEFSLYSFKGAFPVSAAAAGVDEMRISLDEFVVFWFLCCSRINLQ